ncbi:MAG: zinc ribbon domain-containing protein [Methanomicrobiales archaeon]
MIVCSECGHENQDIAVFCTECGRKLESKPVYCSSCGKPNKMGSKFCTFCGEKIQKPIGSTNSESDSNNRPGAEDETLDSDENTISDTDKLKSITDLAQEKQNR